MLPALVFFMLPSFITFLPPAASSWALALEVPSCSLLPCVYVCVVKVTCQHDVFFPKGEYPLAASIATENADEHKTKSRGRQVAMTFACQGFGAFLAPLYVIILLSCTKDLDLVWRIALVPSLTYFFWNWSSTARMKKDIDCCQLSFFDRVSEQCQEYSLSLCVCVCMKPSNLQLTWIKRRANPLRKN